jgi:uncharacterized protein
MAGAVLSVVIDPNVLVSAFVSELGIPYALLTVWAARRFDLVVSPALLAELREVLRRDKFRRYGSDAEVEVFVRRFATARMVADPPTQRIVPADPDDDYLMALARYAKADYVVSGDRHLTELKDAMPPVLSPRAFYELLATQPNWP